MGKLLGTAESRRISKHRSYSGVGRPRTMSHAPCSLSTASIKKFFPNRKAKTNLKYQKSDRSLLLGIKRAPSEYNLPAGKNWLAPHVELDLCSSHKRKKVDHDSFLKESEINEKSVKPSNNVMIKAIDSDDAMDYLRVRKQTGETNKLNIKKAKVFDKVVEYGAEKGNEDTPLH